MSFNESLLPSTMHITELISFFEGYTKCNPIANVTREDESFMQNIQPKSTFKIIFSGITYLIIWPPSQIFCFFWQS